MELKNKNFKEAMETLLAIPSKIKKLESVHNSLPGEYTGDRLLDEQSKISDQIRQIETTRGTIISEVRDKLTSSLITRRDEIAKNGKATAMDASAVTDDYKFLNLPVKLNKDELQTLYDRNWSNPIFVRTLQEYEKKSNTKAGDGIDYADPYQRAINTIYTTLNTVNYYITDKGRYAILPDNPGIIEKWDDQITGALSSVQDE